MTARLGRELYEVPVGFKWFVDGLLDGSLGFGGEESAGASFLRCDGTAWTTDKDGIVPALLSAEITARAGRDPARALSRAHAGSRRAGRRSRRGAGDGRSRSSGSRSSRPTRCSGAELAGEPIERVLVRAPGNDAPIGGIKVIAASGWFAARPSGTEDIYKIYAESFRGEEHLRAVLSEAQRIVDRALAAG